MLRRLCWVLPALALITPSAAFGGPITSLLSFDGSTDLLSDESASIVRDVGTADGQSAGNGFLDAGDIIQGVFELRTINGLQTSSVGGTVLGTLNLEVVSFAANSSGDTVYTFGTVGAVQAANVGVWDLATTMGAAGFSFAGMTPNVAGTASIAILDRSDGNFTIQSGFGNTLPGLTGAVSTLGLVGTDWSVEILGGLSRPDDFYEASFDDLAGAALDLTTSYNPGEDIGAFATAFSIVAHRFGAGTEFLPVTTFDLSTGTAHSSDIASQSNGTLSARDGFTAVGFPLADDGNFIMNPIPEPGSLAIFAGLGAFGAFHSRRRRKAD